METPDRPPLYYTIFLLTLLFLTSFTLPDSFDFMEQISEGKRDLTLTHNPRSKPTTPTHKPPTPNKLSKTVTTHAAFPNSTFSTGRFLVSKR